MWSNFPRINRLKEFRFKISINLYIRYRGILEKGSKDIETAVCYTIYAIYLSLSAQTADPITSKPFLRIPRYIKLSFDKTQCFYFNGENFCEYYFNSLLKANIFYLLLTYFLAPFMICGRIKKKTNKKRESFYISLND